MPCKIPLQDSRDVTAEETNADLVAVAMPRFAQCLDLFRIDAQFEGCSCRKRAVKLEQRPVLREIAHDTRHGLPAGDDDGLDIALEPAECAAIEWNDC